MADLRDVVSDINSTAISAGIGTSFILTYDAVEDNFKFVSPDAIVDSAAGNVSGPAGFSDQVIKRIKIKMRDVDVAVITQLRNIIKCLIKSKNNGWPAF